MMANVDCSVQAFSMGFRRGNFANAYEGDFLFSARLSGFVREFEEDDRRWPLGHDLPPNGRELRAYRLGCLLGFFASYEHHEVPEEWQEPVKSALDEAISEGWGEGILG